jgi:hypothetical protein
MTSTQMLILAGTVWIAPHTGKTTGLFLGVMHIGAACLIGLGVLPK